MLIHSLSWGKVRILNWNQFQPRFSPQIRRSLPTCGVWFRDIDPLCRATSIRPPTPLMSHNTVPLFHPNCTTYRHFIPIHPAPLPNAASRHNELWLKDDKLRINTTEVVQVLAHSFYVGLPFVFRAEPLTPASSKTMRKLSRFMTTRNGSRCLRQSN